MTQDEFQKIVLEKLDSHEVILIEHGRLIVALEQKVDEKLESHEKSMDEKLDVFQEQMVFLIEHEVVTRLDGIAEALKVYTDHQIRSHEKKYHGVSI